MTFTDIIVAPFKITDSVDTAVYTKKEMAQATLSWGLVGGVLGHLYGDKVVSFVKGDR